MYINIYFLIYFFFKFFNFLIFFNFFEFSLDLCEWDITIHHLPCALGEWDSSPSSMNPLTIKTHCIMATSTLFGKEIKTLENHWTVVEGSVKKFTAKMLKDVVEIRVKYSEEYEHYYAVIILNQGYVSWQLDYKFKGEEGDLIDPKSFRVYQLTNGTVNITRCTGKVL